MRWVLRLFGFPVLELHAEESVDPGWSHHTGGQFEIVQEAAEGDFDQSDPEFGFRGSICQE